MTAGNEDLLEAGSFVTYYYAPKDYPEDKPLFKCRAAIVKIHDGNALTIRLSPPNGVAVDMPDEWYIREAVPRMRMEPGAGDREPFTWWYW